MKKNIISLVLLILSSVNLIGQRLTNDNFIYTEVPQRAVKVENYGTLSKTEINQNVTYFDGLGRPKQNIGIGQGANRVNNNLLDWKNSWAIGSGSVPFFVQNGVTVENVRINGAGPFGKSSVLWQCGNDAAIDADGGFNTANITIDKNYSYRYAIWVKRIGSQDGTTYHGTQNVVNLDGTANSNPYFWSGDLPQLDKWYLMVGIIHPASYIGGNSSVSGIYDTGGNKVISFTDFKWSATAVNANFRSYLYYAADVNVRQYFYNPTVQKIDGTEASLSGLCADSDISDIVTHIEYDQFGRQEKEFLPYAVPNPGNEYLKPNALIPTSAFYNTAEYDYTLNPYSQKLFESSPLNRVLRQSAPGNDWALNPTGSDHSIKIENQTNGLDEVKLFKVTTVWDYTTEIYIPSMTQTVNYPIRKLYKTITKDENWVIEDGSQKTTQEFKDKDGRIVLKRTFDLGITYDTYYVYDEYGNLTYVLPPLANGAYDTTTLTKLCYQYRYDYRNRLVEKKLPGKEWEYIVYNRLNQPILTQDANLRLTNKWIYTKYDAFNRTVYTGEYVNALYTTRDLMQTFANECKYLYEVRSETGNTMDGTTVYYSNRAFPDTLNGLNLLTINYYDNYNFDRNGGDSEVVYTITPSATVKGLATGAKVRVLGTSNWITNVTYYDENARPIYSYSKNDFLTTTDKIKSQLDFVGKTLETTRTHTRVVVSVPTTTNIIDAFVYDHAGRLLTQKQKINSQAEEIIASNNYDNLGQLISKEVGGKITQNRLQKVDFKYNVRGWLKNINDVNALGADLFAFKMNYNDIFIPSKRLYNGNISQTFWRTANTDSSIKHYIYTYDALNRLLDATDNLNQYNENITYDPNGNISFLLRSGNTTGTTYGAIDNLTYIYDTGNKLTKVTDSTAQIEGFNNGASGALTDYTYDDNGNMTTDLNKGITNKITYNYLNLPTQIILPGGSINYTYDATGQKLQKKVTRTTPVNVTTTDYAGGYIYENKVMQFFSQPEGYVTNNNNNFSYIYQYKDHLGNVRLSYRDVGTTTPLLQIVEESNYYPFGMKQKVAGEVVNQTGYKYKYNGKELQDELGLNMYDYGARLYDPARAGWSNIDPKAETSRRWSPYNYCYNNPLRFIDPDGMQADDVIISGNKKQEALQELQKSVQGELTLTMDSDGKLSSVQNQNGPLSQGASDVLSAINDKSITVNVNASDNSFVSDNSAPLLGAFMGVQTMPNGALTSTSQEINPVALGKMDAINGKPGQSTNHEVSESYKAGQIAQAAGTSVGPASSADASNPNSIYRQAHDNVTQQSGGISEHFYNASGSEVFRDAQGNVPGAVQLQYTTGSPQQVFHTVP